MALVVVLEDIIKTMHNEKFMAELFKPHHMYSNISTRQIFDRLAHSSIMRLNTNSMDKVRAFVCVFLFMLESGCLSKLTILVVALRFDAHGLQVPDPVVLVRR